MILAGKELVNRMNPYIFMLLFNFFLFLDALERSGTLLNPAETLQIFFYVLAILLAQYVLLYFAKRKIKSPMHFHLLVVLLFMVNFVMIYLVNYVRFLETAFPLQILILLGLAGFFYVLIHHADRWILTLWLALIVILSVDELFIKHTYLLDKIIPPPQHPLPDNYQFQNFTKTPNIYILGFDAMLPEVLARDLLELEPTQSVPYIDALRAENVEFIPNAFTHYPYTIGTYSSLAALDIGWYKSIYGNYRTGREMISGVQWTPLYDIFHRNDYQLKLLYYSDFFKSAFNVKDRDIPLDYSFYKGGGICNHVNSPYAFFGYCLSLKIFGLAKGRHVNQQLYNNEEEFLYAKLEESAMQSKPTITIAHTQHPGHTYGKYNGNNREDFLAYRDYYLQGSRKISVFIKDYIALIRKHDTDGIIVIISDHGPFVSKGIDRTKLTADSQFDEKDIFLDYHAVTIATLDPYGCQLAQPVVTTLTDMMDNLLLCLTDGKKVLKNRYDSEADFTPYLYE